MNDYAWAGQASALLVILAGILTCFWGYRILKLSLGVLGFFAGAYAGWELGLSLAHPSTGVALGFALIGGLIGAVLYVWLFFLGIFLLGATAGSIVAAAFFSGTGHQVQPIVFFVISIIFGVLALVAQKFMIIISTAFSGAYLITAGLWPFVSGSQNPSHIWLNPVHGGSPGTLGYVALVLWLVLGIAGVAFQFRNSPRNVEVAKSQK